MSLDLIESTDFQGLGHYYETLSNAFLNRVLYENALQRTKN